MLPAYNMLAYCTGLLAGVAAVQAQLTNAGIQQVLGSSLQGSSVSLGPFDLAAVANQTHALLSFTVKQSASKIGWMAFGVGSTMANADMLVIWPSGSSWVASRRTASGHSMPVDGGALSNSDISIRTDLSTLTGSTTVVSVLRKLKPSYATTASAGNELKVGTTNNIVYAYSSSNPSGSAASSAIKVHDDSAFGKSSLDLSKTIQLTSTTSGSGTTTNGTAATIPKAAAASTAFDYTDKRTLIMLAHAVVGSLAWMIVSPVMVTLATLGRKMQSWRPVHQWVQVVLTVGLTIAAIALGVQSVNMVKGLHFRGFHQAVGLVMLILLLGQVGLGFFIHHKYDPQRTKKPVRNIGHIVLGILLTAGGFLQVGSGMAQLQNSMKWNVPIAVRAIYGILVGLFLALWTVSSVVSVVVRIKNREPLRREKNLIGMSTDTAAMPFSPTMQQRPRSAYMNMQDMPSQSTFNVHHMHPSQSTLNVHHMHPSQSSLNIQHHAY